MHAEKAVTIYIEKQLSLCIYMDSLSSPAGNFVAASIFSVFLWR